MRRAEAAMLGQLVCSRLPWCRAKCLSPAYVDQARRGVSFGTAHRGDGNPTETDVHELTGIHHLTAISAAIKENHRFACTEM
jgi:hypothetical protein